MTSKVNILFNGNIYQSFDASKMSTVAPRYSGKTGAVVAFDTTLPITVQHVSALYRVAENATLTPVTDLSSHHDVYTFLRLADEFGMDRTTVLKAFNGWTAALNWMSLGHCEYMYPVYNAQPTLVDYGRYFRESTDPFAFIKSAVGMRDVDGSVMVESLVFYQTYVFNGVFEGADDITRDKIGVLRECRKDAFNNALIDPYMPSLNSYFRYAPDTEDLWKCEGISSVPRPQAGSPTIAPHADVVQRLNEYTLGWLDKSPNPEYAGKAFPWENVALAGGFTMQLLDVQFNPKKSSDIDLFVYGKSAEDRARAFETIVHWFHTDQTIYAEKGSVMTVYIVGVNRKFQVINTNNKSIWDIIGRFDMSHIQWAMYNDGTWRIRGTPNAIKSQRDFISRFGCIDRIRAERIVKALYRGRDVEKNVEVIQNHIDISDLIRDVNNTNLKAIVRGFHQYYYPSYQGDPKTMTIAELDEQRQHMEGMIAQDSKCQLVTRDPAKAINDIVLNGNFTTDYEAMAFTTFNVASVVHQGVARRNIKTPVKDRSGIIRLLSGEMTVVSIVNNDNGIELKCRVADPMFTQHIDTLERIVFRVYNNNAVTQHIIGGDGLVRLFLSRFTIDLQTSRGHTLLRSKKGEYLTIEEDLNIDDTIQFVYGMEVNCNTESRFIELRALKIIKTSEHTVHEDDVVEENNRLAVDEKPAAALSYDDVDFGASLDAPALTLKGKEKKIVDKTPDGDRIAEARRRIAERKADRAAYNPKAAAAADDE